MRRLVRQKLKRALKEALSLIGLGQRSCKVNQYGPVCCGVVVG